MTGDRLKKIEERAAAATPGPWTARVNFAVEDGESDAVEVFDSVGVAILDMVAWQKWKTDAAFIASSRTDVPDLVAEVRRLQAENARLAALVPPPFDLQRHLDRDTMN